MLKVTRFDGLLMPILKGAAALVLGVVGTVRAQSIWPTVNYGDAIELTSAEEHTADTNVTIRGKVTVKSGNHSQNASVTSIPVTFGSPSGEPNPAEIIVEGGKFGESNTNLKGGNEVALGDDGGRGKVTVKGGAFHCSKFSISGNTAPESNGYIDFLRIEGGAAYLRQAYNYSTATARVMVAGGTYYSAHQWYGAMFQKGPFLFEA